MVRSKLAQIRQAVYEKYHPLTPRVVLECLGLAAFEAIGLFIFYAYLIHGGRFGETLVSWTTWMWIICLDAIGCSTWLHSELKR
ncbi:hypothetical protein [Alloscardovia macacae]|uniref:Uncharacterized protein n=1 Tax=Alloscardovia macacae TaxID=1160091 RepID=A0A261F7K9_9BIFI|nr:hypothetical protein [Alloscardovia macacae]OZG55078.1 hypothetical protein ALMA_0403 [Alloscardovia macacae]